jgi:hypothetical protein
VLGADRTFSETLNINFQLLSRTESIEASEDQGISLRLANRWFDDSLQAEIGGLHWFKGNDAVVSAKVKYSFLNNYKLGFGLQKFSGKETSSLGRFKELSTTELDVAVMF